MIDEARLFQIINKGLPPDELRRYNVLIERLEDETLTQDEHLELIGLIDQREFLNVERVEAMIELAELRHTTLRVIAETLGIGQHHIAS